MARLCLNCNKLVEGKELYKCVRKNHKIDWSTYFKKKEKKEVGK
ncbi:MAG: hypothetical protein NZ942_03885 [Candidatus Aenigmarchaeota archaeon]|nr:hypothetical protein [Candidatus Aenigmarchaeota archaeon]